MLRIERLRRETFLRRQVTATVLGLSEVCQVNLRDYPNVFTCRLRTAKGNQSTELN